MARDHPREGEVGLSGERSDKDSKGPGANQDRSAGKEQRKADQVGRALRSVYDDTLREDVPDEFEDLLRKLK